MASPYPIIEELRAALRSRPFHPFLIASRDGKKYEIVNSYDMALGERSVYILGKYAPSVQVYAINIVGIEPLQLLAGE